MTKKAYSIRNQLLLMAVGVLILVASAAYYMAQQYGKRAAELSYDRLMTGAAHQIAEGISLYNENIIVNLPLSAFQTLSLAEEDRAFYKISSEKQGFLTGYSDISIDTSLQNVSAYTYEEQNSKPFFYDINYQGETLRLLIFSKLITETNYSDIVHIHIAQSMRARENLANDISLGALQIIVPFFAIALMLVMFGIIKLLRPIKRVNHALSNRSATDLHPLDFEVPAEVSNLVDTINHFMRQLDDTLENLKSFTSEATHQMRTPLAGLKSQAQNALEEEDPQKRHEQLKRVVESCDVLNDTVNKLLDQAVLTHRFQSGTKQPVALDQLIKKSCRETAVTALRQGIEISYTDNGPTIISGDEFALTQMIRNILDNAIKYSAKKDIVEVDLKKYPLSVVLKISDCGPGISDEEKAHVFERFYRSPNNPRKGSGLGLAIAKDIAEHHLAKLDLIDNKPQGLTVRIIFNMTN